MEKKLYTIPCTTIVTFVPERVVAMSLEKGTEEFNPESMKFTKEDRAGRGSRSDYNVWKDDWSNN